MATRGHSRLLLASERGTMIPAGRIDCHVHFYPPAFADMLLGSQTAVGGPPLRSFVLAAAKPAWRDLGALRQVMDETGVGLGVIIPTGSLVDMLRPAGPGATQKFNQSMSTELATSEGRFVAAAVVDPLGGPDEVVQLDHSLSLPHIAAVGLVASYDGRGLDDPIFEPIFEAARAHDAPVLVHPSAVSSAWKQALRLDSPILEAGFGFLMDDALTILRMAIHGTFDRFSNVRFMFCQLGGFAPACCARWDYHVKHQRTMSRMTGQPLPSWANGTLRDYLSRVWLDTHSQDRHGLRLVMDLLGDGGVVLGGDYPITPTEDGVPHVMGELAALGVSDSTRRKIERENAEGLLGRH
jgi:predicted TIM-barrel fold metal-dependent hydrolase